MEASYAGIGTLEDQWREVLEVWSEYLATGCAPPRRVIAGVKTPSTHCLRFIAPVIERLLSQVATILFPLVITVGLLSSRGRKGGLDVSGRALELYPIGDTKGDMRWGN